MTRFLVAILTVSLFSSIVASKTAGSFLIGRLMETTDVFGIHDVVEMLQ